MTEVDPVAAHYAAELMREQLIAGADRVEIERVVRALDAEHPLGGREVNCLAIRVTSPEGIGEVVAIEDVLALDGLGYLGDLSAELDRCAAQGKRWPEGTIVYPTAPDAPPGDA